VRWHELMFLCRFNGLDGRLDRSMEAACVIMEAFDGHSARIQYDMLGHSGETSALPLVSCSQPPRNDRERLQVLHRMHAHTQFCESGDTTVAAIEAAARSAAKMADADERVVVVVRCGRAVIATPGHRLLT
jgi:von Willebrand factor A domain-containing protein 8